MANQFQHFGKALRYFRETYQERINRWNPITRDMRMLRIAALSPVGYMERKTYSISSGATLRLKRGSVVPRPHARFWGAASTCLAIEGRGEEWRMLLQQSDCGTATKAYRPEHTSFILRQRAPRSAARTYAQQNAQTRERLSAAERMERSLMERVLSA